jgi:IS30 family transposase
LTTVTAEEEIMIMDHINLRPRKCLDFRAPYEVFPGLTALLLHLLLESKPCIV